jgi:hypothetical protein
LIGLFPILSLYAHNVYETRARSLVLPIGLTLALSLVTWLALWCLTRDRHRAALATSLLVVLFFAFHQCRLILNALLVELSAYWVRTEYDVPPLMMSALLTLVTAPAFVSIFRRVKDPGLWSAYLNVFALILLLLPVSNVAMARMREPAAPIIRSRGGIPITKTPARLPDIYFIILDAYARSDVMKDLFDFDNGPFLSRLEQKGFFVARNSRSNYCQTTASLCSTLNCDYLDTLIAPGARDKDPLSALIRDNLVVKSLRPLGYKFVAFSSGYDFTECTEADLFLNARHPADNFQMMMVRMTPLQYLPFKLEYWDFYTSLRERILFVLDHLPDVAEEKEPTFTFAHIVCPHHPFIFGEDGEDVSPRGRKASGVGGGRHHGPGVPENYREGYRKQAIFITKRVEQTIDRVLARSPEPPIIILQSDHGSGLRHHLDDLEKTDLRERMSTLNCYYFPDRNYDGLTETITPVNSFRVVLNNHFGTKLPLLDNRNLFSTYGDPFKFKDVTERINSGIDSTREFALPDFYPGMVH